MALSLFASIVTVLTGVIVLAFWSQPERTRRDRRSTRLGFLHVTVAVTALALWTIFVVGRASVIGRVSLGLLAGAAVAGIATLLSSRRGERAHDDIEAVPILALVVHTLFVGLTITGAVIAFASR